MTDLVRTDLAEYAPASNLLFNEHIRDLIQSGRKIYHFAFGQSPFPVVESAVQALKDHAGENAYLPVAGRFLRYIDRKHVNVVITNFQLEFFRFYVKCNCAR